MEYHNSLNASSVKKSKGHRSLRRSRTRQSTDELKKNKAVDPLTRLRFKHPRGMTLKPH